MSSEVEVRRGEAAADLHREWLAPESTTLWVDLVYRLLLGRPAEADALLGSWRSLVLQPGSRLALVREIVSSREFAEAALVEELVAEVSLGNEWTARLAGHGDTTERVVEVPWVLSRLRRERRVLDIGTRHAFDGYATALLRLTEGTTVVGVDLVMHRMPGLAGVAGDACRLPFAPGTFSFISCISTLEHIGHDNSRYGTEAPTGSAAEALRELARVLDPSGHLAVTVPYGRAEHHGWFAQFDERGWRSLLAATPLEAVEEEVFALEPGGWARCEDRTSVANVGYRSRGEAAGAVLCALLRRR